MQQSAICFESYYVTDTLSLTVQSRQLFPVRMMVDFDFTRSAWAGQTPVPWSSYQTLLGRHKNGLIANINHREHVPSAYCFKTLLFPSTTSSFSVILFYHAHTRTHTHTHTLALSSVELRKQQRNAGIAPCFPTDMLSVRLLVFYNTLTASHRAGSHRCQSGGARFTVDCLTHSGTVSGPCLVTVKLCIE